MVLKDSTRPKSKCSEADVAKKSIVIKRVKTPNGVIDVKQASRGGLNNVQCGNCSGTRQRKADGSLHCPRCSTSAKETPL